MGYDSDSDDEDEPHLDAGVLDVVYTPVKLYNGKWGLQDNYTSSFYRINGRVISFREHEQAENYAEKLNGNGR